MKKILSIAFGLVLVFGLTGCEVEENPAKLNPTICTMDAKGCPDGSFVGRTGPNCEFAKCPEKPLKPDFVPTKDNPIQLPKNVITEKDCAAAGGEVWNTLGKTSYDGELIGKVEGLLCPCACLIKSKKSDVLWINKNGNLEEFAGNLDDIQTFDDCKKAGFKIRDGEPASCQTGEPHMTGGKYKTFTNNQIKTGKICIDYTYSNCPGSCVAKCTPSSCGEPWIEDGEEMRNCTSDCDGPNSCVEKQNPAKNEIPKICTLEYEPVCGTPYFCLISKFAAGQIPAECTDGKTYGNKCNLESAKAIFKYNGECKNSRDFEPKQKACTKEYFPVCGEIDTEIRCIKAPCPSTEQKTFSNKCLAENAGAKIIYEGKCREKSENPAKSCTEGDRKECIIMPDGNEACIADAIHVCKNGKWEIEGDFFFPEEITPPLPPTENEIPKNCTNWFDGCNNCMVMPDGGLACTKMACFEQKEAYCTKFKE